MREVSTIGIRREFGPRWFHLSLGRNYKSKVGPHKFGPPYANATLRFGWYPFFSFHAWHNNYGNMGSYIETFGWIIGLAGIYSSCDHPIQTQFLPNIHKAEKI